jgi:hypothetical protein
MALAARKLVRPMDLASRASLPDTRFHQLTYLHGWWYASTTFLGFGAVRLRLPGDVGSPSSAARAAVLSLEQGEARVMQQIEPRLWAEYDAAREGGKRPVRSARRSDTMREHFRLDAVCAGPFGENGLVELMLEARWAAEHFVAAYFSGMTLTEFRTGARPWRTPR